MSGFRDYIEQLRAANDIRPVIGERIEVNRSNKAKCPFHEDTDPSLSINVKGRYFQCFGCGAAGDVFKFVEMYEQVPFAESVRILAQRAGIPAWEYEPEKRAEYERERQRTDVLTAAACYYHARLTPEAREYLTKKRGLPEELIERFQLGWADGGLKAHLLKEGYDEGLCIEAGVLRNDDGYVRDFLFHRVTFPTLWRGQATQISGRSIDSSNPKYLHLPGEIERLYNENALANRAVNLAEGPLDALSLEAIGLPTVASMGIGTSRQVSKLMRCDRITSWYDADAAGRNGTSKLGDTLGLKLRIVTMPPGRDVNDLLVAGETDLIRGLCKTAVDPFRHKINQIDIGTPKTDLAQVLVPMLKDLAAKSDAAYVEAFLNQTVKDRFDLKTPDINSYRRIIKEAQKTTCNHAEPEAKTQYVWDDYEVLSPAQDFVGGDAYFTVYLTEEYTDSGGRTSTKRRPHLITSRREMLPLNEDELAKRGLRLSRPNQIPSDLGRWSTGRNAPNGVRAFVEGRARVRPLEVLEEVVALFREYLEYPDPRYYVFMALWVIGTYVFRIFESYPYVHLSGTKRIGKTRTMEVAEPLAFNATLSTSISDASMFRVSDTDRSTILHDEAAKYQRKRLGDTSDRLEIFNTGYKRNGAVTRCEGDDRVPTRFSTFCPKMLASIEELDPTSADRTISLQLLRARNEVKPFRFREIKDRTERLRNSLYVLAMTFAKDIQRIYETQEPVESIRDRQEELWCPILTLTEFFDSTLLEHKPEMGEPELLAPQMLSLAKDCWRRKEQEDVEESLELRILRGTAEFLRNGIPLHDADDRQTNIYLSNDVLFWLRKSLQMEKLSKTRISRALSQFRVILPEQGDKATRRVDVAQKRLCRSSGRQVMCYRLDPARLRDAAERYGVDMDRNLENGRSEVYPKTLATPVDTKTTT